MDACNDPCSSSWSASQLRWYCCMRATHPTATPHPRHKQQRHYPAEQGPTALPARPAGRGRRRTPSHVLSADGPSSSIAATLNGPGVDSQLCAKSAVDANGASRSAMARAYRGTYGPSSVPMYAWMVTKVSKREGGVGPAYRRVPRVEEYEQKIASSMVEPQAPQNSPGMRVPGHKRKR
jgi:hypothetical protein